MTKNPYYNALLALGYISIVVLVISQASKWATQNADENLLMPIVMLSVFVISATVMGFIVLYQPIILLLDGKRNEAVSLLLRTIAMFAAVTLTVFIIALSFFK